MLVVPFSFFPMFLSSFPGLWKDFSVSSSAGMVGRVSLCKAFHIIRYENIAKI